LIICGRILVFRGSSSPLAELSSEIIDYAIRFRFAGDPTTSISVICYLY